MASLLLWLLWLGEIGIWRRHNLLLRQVLGHGLTSSKTIINRRVALNDSLNITEHFYQVRLPTLCVGLSPVSDVRDVDSILLAQVLLLLEKRDWNLLVQVHLRRLERKNMRNDDLDRE